MSKRSKRGCGKWLRISSGNLDFYCGITKVNGVSNKTLPKHYCEECSQSNDKGNSQ